MPKQRTVCFKKKKKNFYFINTWMRVSFMKKQYFAQKAEKIVFFILIIII